MNDLRPFEHGEEGTHAVCNKHNAGYKSVCCECNKRTDCSDFFAGICGGGHSKNEIT